MIQLYDYQASDQSKALEALKRHQKVLFQASTGYGKCLGAGTPILMFDGSIKKVEDVNVGDLIMGMDSTPRKVLSLARGKEEMFRITPVKGDSWICNRSHILSLKVNARVKVFDRMVNKGDIVNISVNDYLEQSKTFKHVAKQFRVGVEFEHKELPIPPYLLGLWLGDGTSRLTTLELECSDIEIITYLNKYSHSINHRLSVQVDKRPKPSNSYSIVNDNNFGCVKDSSHIKYQFEKLNLHKNKHIPFIFKTSSRIQRLELLAGILDTDGHKVMSGYDVIFKQEVLANDLAFLCRSLGLSAYVKKQKKSWVYKGVKKWDWYYRISISGDLMEVPIRVERKKPSPRLQKKDVLVTGFKIESIGEGEYYGFEISGDRRFLLGDFTVTHNTVVMTDLVAKLIKNYNYNILILVHRSELLEQTRNALIKFGISSEPIDAETKFLLRNTNVYVAMVETIHNRLSKDSNFLTDIDLIITDEAHIQVFHKVTDFFPNAKELAFTATPLINKRERFNLCTFCNSESESKICSNCNNETHEYSRPVTMSQFYDTIVVGYPIHKLIERGTLVPELPMAFSASGLENLKVGSDGDYTTKSLNEVYEQEGNLLSVMENYKTYCTGKKTIIFNSSSKINLIIYEQFKAEGINVRMFDSVNSKESGDRDELLKWFETTPRSEERRVGK